MSAAVIQHAEPLRVDGLSLSFGGIQVLSDISLRLEAGEITGLIGPNGAGKTSFFNCLTGIYAPTQGGIEMGGLRLEALPPFRRAALGFSRSFQHVALCPELTIAENVMIGLDRLSRAGWLHAFLPLPAGRKERARNRALALGALERLGIAQVADSRPAELPPGLLRLAEIARAIVGEPRVLLLDEPAAGLNSIETRDLAAALKKLRSPDLVLVVVEHDMDLIMDVCDRIFVLNVGRLLASGTPAQVRANPEVVKVYLGDEDE
ncbi:ABC transporter ATP-binding protein [Parapusillimonas granuli]|uniref:ABC transporter ATP-binding protein n=1 Tax=Parapusillimonas granuli TaxID=380911 RepID=A0A853G515_9BURK|nr:ABC transporter ATP-binding protein [Parapusillimonas granuli]MBB5214305.1 branched-chain amino acid transport system ATP-binding protein [Parapusillimonas granuli]MEB2399118.1 ABC transporter ATP-binding protein [Alcaligenaceae bacterium]NYT51409.1 ABC transporter ATP-binding protein [Parapusillimonas granuli]